MVTAMSSGQMLSDKRRRRFADVSRPGSVVVCSCPFVYLSRTLSIYTMLPTLSSADVTQKSQQHHQHNHNQQFDATPTTETTNEALSLDVWLRDQSDVIGGRNANGLVLFRSIDYSALYLRRKHTCSMSTYINDLNFAMVCDVGK